MKVQRQTNDWCGSSVYFFSCPCVQHVCHYQSSLCLTVVTLFSSQNTGFSRRLFGVCVVSLCGMITFFFWVYNGDMGLFTILFGSLFLVYSSFEMFIIHSWELYYKPVSPIFSLMLLCHRCLLKRPETLKVFLQACFSVEYVSSASRAGTLSFCKEHWERIWISHHSQFDFCRSQVSVGTTLWHVFCFILAVSTLR